MTTYRRDGTCDLRGRFKSFLKYDKLELRLLWCIPLLIDCVYQYLTVHQRHKLKRPFVVIVVLNANNNLAIKVVIY